MPGRTVTEAQPAQVVIMTDEEKRNGKYSAVSLGKALEAMHQDGLVVLKGVIDAGHIEALNEKMCADAEIRRKDPNQAYNHSVRCESLFFDSIPPRIYE